MILPLRVFGSAAVKWMWSGVAMGPMLSRTWRTSWERKSSLMTVPSFTVT